MVIWKLGRRRSPLLNDGFFFFFFVCSMCGGRSWGELVSWGVWFV